MPAEAREEAEGGEVVDLLAVLSRSLGGSATGATRKPARRAPAKKRRTSAKKQSSKKK
jgi:hypothetical protein